MRPRMSRFAPFAAGLLAVLLLAVAAGVAAAASGDRHPGKGLGRTKVTICHKGQTITIAQPAWPAHHKQGDTLGACPGHAPQATAILTVIKHVVNDEHGTKTAADFTLTINGVSVL